MYFIFGASSLLELATAIQTTIVVVLFWRMLNCRVELLFEFIDFLLGFDVRK